MIAVKLPCQMGHLLCIAGLYIAADSWCIMVRHRGDHRVQGGVCGVWRKKIYIDNSSFIVNYLLTILKCDYFFVKWLSTHKVQLFILILPKSRKAITEPMRWILELEMEVKIYQPEGLVFSDSLSLSLRPTFFFFLQLTVQISRASFTGCHRRSLKNEESNSETHLISVLQAWGE